MITLLIDEIKRQNNLNQILKLTIMTISISKTLKHETPKTLNQKLSNDQIQEIIYKSCQKIGLSPEAISINNNGVMQIQKSNDLKLHTLLLTLEEHGLNMSLTRQTLIEVA